MASLPALFEASEHIACALTLVANAILQQAPLQF
jgi:hypothetical protein